MRLVNSKELSDIRTAGGFFFLIDDIVLPTSGRQTTAAIFTGPISSQRPTVYKIPEFTISVYIALGRGRTFVEHFKLLINMSVDLIVKQKIILQKLSFFRKADIMETCFPNVVLVICILNLDV